LYKWSLNFISLSYFIYRMLFFNHVTCYLNRDNKKTDIEYNINYIYKKLFTLNKKKLIKA